jgi:hypothetical protein
VVVELALPIASVPLPVDASEGTEALMASTVNGVEPAGVTAVVVIVSVEVREFCAPVKVTLLGLKDAVAPLGKEVVMLKSAVKLPVAPGFRFTVTV